MGSDLKLPIIPLLQHDAGCTLCLWKFWGFIFASEVSVCSLWIYGNTCQRYPQDPAAAERKNLGRDWCGEESLIARHEHRASQDCPVERLCSLLATISSIPYQILFLRRDSSVLWKWEPSSSALCGGRCDPTRRTELASLFMEILFFLFCFVSLFFFSPSQFTVTFYLFVQKNKLVICTLHKAFCHLLCLAPRRNCYAYSTCS